MTTAPPEARRRPRGGAGNAACLAAAAGVIMLALPALTAPAPAQAITAAGLAAVIVGLARPVARRPWAGILAATPTFAAAAAVALCVLARQAAVSTAASGLLIAGYLLLVDMPRPGQPRGTLRWLAAQVPGMLAAAAVSGAVLAALALPDAPSAWICLTGIAAAVAAYLIAVPRPKQPPT